MKTTLLIITLLIAGATAAQDCKTLAANKASTTSRGLDAFMGITTSNQKPASWNLTKMKPHLAKAEEWIKNILSGFTGAKLLYSNDYFLDYEHGGYSEEFYKAAGVKGFYRGIMRFFAYYCYDNNEKIFTEAESGSFVHVTFNNVLASALCTEVGTFSVGGKPVFKIFEKNHSEGRFDFYEQKVKSNSTGNYFVANDIIIVRNSDKPVFVLVTRKEYLQQLLKDIETYRTTQKKFLVEMYTSNAKMLEEEIKVKKTYDKNYTAAKEAQDRKRFAETNSPEQSEKAGKKIDDEVNGANKIITQYLNKPQDWLNRGFSNFYPFASYSANGLQQYFDRLDTFSETENGEDTRTQVVSLNVAYFNKALSADVPQLISVYLARGTYAHTQKVAALIKKPGALAPLEEILSPRKGGSTETIPAELTTVFTLRYLPKLAGLTPLTVPADMKPSIVLFPNTAINSPTAPLNASVPVRSPKLNQLPQLVSADNYKTYLQQLYTAISDGLKPDEKKKADDYVKNKKLTQPKEISQAAFAAWLQNSPKQCLYLYSKALSSDPSDAMIANNYSAFLIMAGLPEKSIPLLEYLNKQKPGEATILCNLGNAYYKLGDPDKAITPLLQAVQYDTLNPVAHKILGIIYLKKGDTKKAHDHAVKSLTASYDEQVTAMLRHLNKSAKPGEIMSRPKAKEFPMLKKVKLPAMPSSLDEMDDFLVELDAEKKSVDATIENINSKRPGAGDDVKQKIMMSGFAGGISALRVKAQFIIMDGMQTYQQETIRESDVFKHNLKKISSAYSATVKAISAKYAAKLKKLEGGEGGDEDEIAALESARCKEINAEKQKHLAVLSPLVNAYAQRREFISRKFYRDYANWAPYWLSQTNIPFPSIERDYLKDISGILSEYETITKSNCIAVEPPAPKTTVLKDWEDEYCANFKGKIGIGPAKITWTCNSWGVEGGEGILGEIEVKYSDDGTFEDFTIGTGIGETMSIGEGKIVKGEASVSIKEFIKLGPNKATGKWEVKDFGTKGEVSVEGSVGALSTEIKLVELAVTAHAGLEVGGVMTPILYLK
jgi:tetratricopeptide (TPR) repeat protein